MTKDTYVQTFDFAGKNVTLEAGSQCKTENLEIEKEGNLIF
jgi:hypothetical protein